MTIKEDMCVDCGLPCLGNTCPMKNYVKHICDQCKDNRANYRFSGSDWCEECLEAFLEQEFKALNLRQRAWALDYDCEEIR